MRPTSPNPEIELLLLDAEASQFRHQSFLRWLRDHGVPDEIVFRLARIWRATRRVGRRVIHVGRIVLKKVCEFMREHPGLLIGAALGAALGLLAGSIPVLGKVLGPVVAFVGIWLGAAVGHDLDRVSQGGRPGNPLSCALEAAHLFFRFLVDLFRTAFMELRGAPAC